MALDETLNQDLLKSLWFWISLSIRTQYFPVDILGIGFGICVLAKVSGSTRQPCSPILFKLWTSKSISVLKICMYSNVAMFLGTEDKAFRGYAGIFNVSHSCLKV
jgi:hypothetical protein